MEAAVALLEELAIEPRIAGAAEAWLRSLAAAERHAMSAAPTSTHDALDARRASSCAARSTCTSTSRPTSSSGGSTTSASHALRGAGARAASC